MVVAVVAVALRSPVLAVHPPPALYVCMYVGLVGGEAAGRVLAALEPARAQLARAPLLLPHHELGLLQVHRSHRRLPLLRLHARVPGVGAVPHLPPLGVS